MAAPLDALARAVEGRSMRLALFDVGLRQQTGQWTLERRVPLESTVAAFAEHGAFIDADGRVRIPLHESATAALSNEFVIVDPDHETVQYGDLAAGNLRRVPLAAFCMTYPAWRLRFWTDAYPIDTAPPFLDVTADETTGLEATTTPVAGRANVQQAADFFDEARSALVSRRDLIRSDAREAFRAVADREFVDERGGVIGIEFHGREIDEFGQQIVSLRIPAGHPLADASQDVIAQKTGLRAGDEVIIDASARAELPVEAELFEIEHGDVHLGVYWDSARGATPEAAFDPDSDVSFTIGKLVDGRRFDAIDAALTTVEHNDRTREIYAGTAELRFTADPPSVSTLDLNRHQANAASRALAAEALCCIESPPWTGSRRTIEAIVHGSLARDRRIAIITPDRSALDSLLAPLEWDVDLHRLDTQPGSTGSDADMLATPLDRAGELDDHGVDLAIVDQAGRIPVPAGAIPFAKARRVVCIGDPMQSPLTPIDRAVKPTLAPSLYDHLTAAYGTGCLERLRHQYRMNQAIALFPNRTFYDGRLIHGSENRNWTLDAAPPLEACHVAGREIETPTGSYLNEAEVQAVVAEVRALRERGCDPTQLGIITPYSAQVGKIRVAVQDDFDANSQIAVGGIDRFRCAHRDAIIISTVRTADPETWATEGAEAFWTDRGLNVALTRASKRMVLIGDWRTLDARRGVCGESDPFARLSAFLTERGLLPASLE